VSPAGHALDRRLLALRTLHETVDTDLHELEVDPAFVLLAAATTRLDGATAALAGPALATLAELSPGLAPLEDLIEWVGSLRSVERVDDERATELVAQLNSPCIAIADTPDAEPDVLTPQDMLTRLDEAIATLREVTVAVEDAWRDVPGRVEAALAEADRLVRDFPGLHTAASARLTLTMLPARVVGDPLGAADELAEIETSLAELTELSADMGRQNEALANATATLAEIEDAIASGRDDLAASRAEIHQPRGLLDAVDEDVVVGERGLRPWLGRLERLVADGKTALAGKGIESWQALADQTLSTARQVAKANQRPVGRRHELLRLLEAAKVKAHASGRGTDPRVTDLAARADKALAVPCDLEDAQVKVDAYLDELRRQQRVPA
jgi:hypothetical protein